MKILTKQDLIEGVHLAWSKQYLGWTGKNALIGEKLKSAKTKQEVDSIIGNDSWTKLICSCCGEDSDIVAELVNDNESYFSICLICVDKTKSEMEGVK